jgi:hypothetical protein
MRKLTILLSLSFLIFTACQENNSILEPTTPNYEQPNVSMNFSDQSSDEFGERISVIMDDTVFVVKKLSKKLTINGNKGGKVSLKYTYKNKDGKKVKLDADLTIPKHAFKNELTFNINFDLENYVVEFAPHPFTFDIPVILDLKFSNIDLSGFDLDKLTFDYLDGEPTHLSFDKIKYDLDKGDLEILGAQIPHFSRYGWTRIAN